MSEFNQFVVSKKYKGKIIKVRVCDGVNNGRRSTTIVCKYNPLMFSFSNASDEMVDYYIMKDFKIAQDKIDENSFTKKLVKKFK